MLISSTTLSVLLLIGEKHAVLQMKFSFLPSRFLLFTFFFLITFLGRELYLTFKAEAFSLRSRFISLLNRERINCPFMLNANERKLDRVTVMGAVVGVPVLQTVHPLVQPLVLPSLENLQSWETTR